MARAEVVSLSFFLLSCPSYHSIRYVVSPCCSAGMCMSAHLRIKVKEGKSKADWHAGGLTHEKRKEKKDGANLIFFLQEFIFNYKYEYRTYTRPIVLTYAITFPIMVASFLVWCGLSPQFTTGIILCYKLQHCWFILSDGRSKGLIIKTVETRLKKKTKTNQWSPSDRLKWGEGEKKATKWPLLHMMGIFLTWVWYLPPV